ncbi:EAL domain-containing protein [Burkholderia stabilis]|nr:EAL domain-containing protein [Burkholderia stabilis]
MNALFTAAVRHTAGSPGAGMRDSDVRVAGAVLDSIVRDRVVLFAQPVFDSGCRQVLYHECLVRIQGDHGRTDQAPSTFIPSLERLGLIRFLDRYVLGLVIEHLDAHPDLRLGANVSAQSASEISRWEPIFAMLEGRPDMARRLVIEITETTRLSRSSGHAFTERLQRLGCRIAMDDFGDGFGIENCNHVPSVDIVKISGKMLPRSIQDWTTERDQFRRLLEAAREIAPCVVVEGIETPDDLLLAQSAGADSVQGYLIGRPDFLRGSDRSVRTSSGRTADRFEKMMDAFVEESIDVDTHAAARTAYRAGLASVIFGRDSAIATRLVEQTVVNCREIGSRSERRIKLIRCLYLFGRRNGRALTRSTGLEGGRSS